MSKRNTKNSFDTENYSRSTFTLSFVIEILNIEETECEEGWFDLGPCVQELKMHYQIYPNQSFDVDIFIWPNIAKVWCGNQQCFVRTWQLLGRRWLAFTIRHVYPARVLDMINNVATITPGAVMGAQSANAKNDKNTEACLAPLKFLEVPHFGRVLGKVESLEHYVRDFIWERIESYVPSSHWDGPFDTPLCVTDLRHQNKIFELIREVVEKQETIVQNEEIDASRVTLKSDTKKLSDKKSTRSKSSNKSSKLKSKSKKSLDVPKHKYELKLSGIKILAGIGQVVPFESVGRKGPDMGDVLCLVSSYNFPANDDMPIILVIVKNLVDIPLEYLHRLGITHLFLTYRICDEIYCSEKKELHKINNVNFNYYNAIPLSLEAASEIASSFLDNPLEIEIRGVSLPNVLFETLLNNENISIGVTKIDVSQLTKGPNYVNRGEYYVNPFVDTREYKLESDEEVDHIEHSDVSHAVVSSYVVLQANMSLDVTIGVAGCRPTPKIISYSRMYCLISDSGVTKCFTKRITATNENVAITDNKEKFITGFSVNVGDLTIVYVEGPQTGPLDDIVMFSLNFAEIKVLFSVEDKYSTRLYPEMLSSTFPFVCLIMRTPIYVLLKNSDVYVKSKITIRAKKALLKIGCLISCNLKLVPNRSDMPTFDELKCFKRELCHPLKAELEVID